MTVSEQVIDAAPNLLIIAAIVFGVFAGIARHIAKSADKVYPDNAGAQKNIKTGYGLAFRLCWASAKISLVASVIWFLTRLV